MNNKSSEPFTTRTTLELGNLYDSNVERTAYHTEIYKKLYDLPSYCIEEMVTPELFAYCRRRNFFVNIVAFQERKIFLKRNMGSMLGWSLPGSAILSKKDELFQDAVYRIIRRDIPDIEIGELKPIAYLEKTYRLEKESVTHRGITFMARVRYPNQNIISRNEDIKGQFISIDDLRESKRLCPFEAELFNLSRYHIDGNKPEDYDAIEGEILSYSNISRSANFIHKYIVGPIGKRYSSRKIKNEILRYIKPTDFFLDIACGDDNFIWKVAKTTDFCVANDIQWTLIKKLISAQTDHAHKVIFVNHDACHLPFRKRFDIVLCKNMLHHMTTKKQLIGLLSCMRKIGKKILIVDPETPSSSLRGKLWHLYYVRLLKDRGERFFSLEFLKNTVKEFYPDAINIDINRIQTIKGYFIFCLIDFSGDSVRDLSIAVKERYNMHNLTEIMDNRKAVIFDFDGLLFDTERVFIEAVRSVLHKKGVELKDKDYIGMDLQNGSSVFEHYLEVGLLDSIDHLQDEVYTEYDSMVNQGIKELPGAKNVVNLLFKKYKLAIASSSKRKYIDKILSDHGLLDKFEVIISRESTNHLKPNPECLRLVLKQLSLRADECILVEDTIRGLKAAKAIGMRCIIVPNELTKDAAFREADLIVNSLQEIVVTND